MDRDELERKRREMELLLANESQMSHDEKTRILLKLLGTEEYSRYHEMNKGLAVTNAHCI